MSLVVPNLAFLELQSRNDQAERGSEDFGGLAFCHCFLFSEKTNQKCGASPYVWVNKLLSPSVPALQPGMLQESVLAFVLVLQITRRFT